MKENYPVRFIFFSTEKGQKHEEILGFARELFFPSEISIHSGLDGFAKAVLEPLFDHRVILIMVTSSDDLAGILLLRDLLEDRLVILILPDTKKDTMTRALSLYPRYIDYIQNDMTGLKLVLKKMVKKIRGQIKSEKK